MKPVYDCIGFIFYNLMRMFTLNIYYLTSKREHFASYQCDGKHFIYQVAVSNLVWKLSIAEPAQIIERLQKRAVKLGLLKEFAPSGS